MFVCFHGRLISTGKPRGVAEQEPKLVVLRGGVYRALRVIGGGNKVISANRKTLGCYVVGQSLQPQAKQREMLPDKYVNRDTYIASRVDVVGSCRTALQQESASEQKEFSLQAEFLHTSQPW